MCYSLHDEVLAQRALDRRHKCNNVSRVFDVL